MKLNLHHDMLINVHLLYVQLSTTVSQIRVYMVDVTTV